MLFYGSNERKRKKEEEGRKRTRWGEVKEKQNHAAQMAVVMQMSRQESRSSAGPDHVTLQALITWLIKSRSRD